jgi:hypothetical protein
VPVPQVAAIGLDFIAGAAQLETVAHLGLDAFATQESERCVGKKLRRSREGPMGKAQAIEQHAGHGFARRHHCLIIWHEMPVNHVHQPSVLDDSSNQTSVIETLDAHLCHLATLP